VLQTNEAGEYVARNLAPGLYQVTVEAPGFKKFERRGIRLEVATNLGLDFQLTPGAATEVLTVTGEQPLVETVSNTLGGTFSNVAIHELPLQGRDFQNLDILRPGIQRIPGGGFQSITANGNRPEDNNFIIDGIDDNDAYYGTTVINAEGVEGTPPTHLPIDAIQEFHIQSGPEADYGWKPGAIINIGIKSGTNAFHGSTNPCHEDQYASHAIARGEVSVGDDVPSAADCRETRGRWLRRDEKGWRAFAAS
jgi:hypothetical protein